MKTQTDTPQPRAILASSGPMVIDFRSGKLVPVESGDYSAGTIVSYGDQANPRTRYAITGPPVPDSHGHSHGQPCTSERGNVSTVSKSAIEGPGGWHLEDCPPMTPTDLADFLFEGAETHVRLTREAETKARKEAIEESQAIAALRREHPALELAEFSKKSCQALAAANIRKLLKQKFPGQKFSVTSESFSMGNAVRVNWEDGPTSKEVEKITSPFVSSGSDGMQDLSYHVSSPWHIFGDSKYITTSRDLSQENRETVAAEVIEAHGLDREPAALAEEARMGTLWGDDEWIRRKMHEAREARSFYVPAA